MTMHDTGAALGAANWLSLAAAPSFAIMALFAARGGAPDMVCATAHDASPLASMAAMYWLMSAFHLVPWLKLIATRRGDACQPTGG